MNCYLYARKSTESEDRQILSIDAQIKELKTVALNRGLKIVEIFSEAKSAKAPGRPIFNKMMKKVFENQGMNVICWKLDRLARNPVDGGQLIWAIEKKGVNEIVTPHRSFKNNGDDKFWMQLEFGMAKKYIDDLSDNVKRGNRAKLEKGILPGKAPIGYLNDKENHVIVKDQNRFHLIRRIWDVVLSGQYRVKELLLTAEKDWGLLSRQTKKRGGKPLQESTLYQILSNPFYYGMMKRKGELYPGTHETMITKDEFDEVQRLLGRPDKRPHTKSFAYTGLIRCDECGSMITAEHKINRYGYHYTYYRCTKRKGGIKNDCNQKYVRAEDLEKQIGTFLERFNVSEQFVSWIDNRFEQTKANEKILRAETLKSLRKSLEETQLKLDNLLHLRLKDMLTDEEYLSEKSAIADKKRNFESKIASLEANGELWFEPFQKFISFARLAKKSFLAGDDILKRKILAALGSNFFLKDRILLIETKKPFQLIVETAQNPSGWALVEDVRTFFADPLNHFIMPDLEKSSRSISTIKSQK